MEQIENYIFVGSTFVVLIFWAFVSIKYLRSWKQLKKAFEESGMKWPLHPQEEINDTARANVLEGHKMMRMDMGQAARILFTLRSDNPLIKKPLRSMRRALIAFVLFPFLFAFVLVVTFAFLSV